MILYVDGDGRVRTDTMFGAAATSGYWRIGGDNVGSWPAAGTSAYFNGDIDNVAIYHHALTAAQVAAPLCGSRPGQVPNHPPTAASPSRPMT